MPPSNSVVPALSKVYACWNLTMNGGGVLTSSAGETNWVSLVTAESLPRNNELPLASEVLPQTVAAEVPVGVHARILVSPWSMLEALATSSTPVRSESATSTRSWCRFVRRRRGC
jgi:hypothetical protein